MIPNQLHIWSSWKRRFHTPSCRSYDARIVLTQPNEDGNWMNLIIPYLVIPSYKSVTSVLLHKLHIHIRWISLNIWGLEELLRGRGRGDPFEAHGRRAKTNVLTAKKASWCGDASGGKSSASLHCFALLRIASYCFVLELNNIHQLLFELRLQLSLAHESHIGHVLRTKVIQINSAYLRLVKD